VVGDVDHCAAELSAFIREYGLTDVPAEAIDADLEAHYATALWVEGGD
jgi:hypothetical protein